MRRTAAAVVCVAGLLALVLLMLTAPGRVPTYDEVRAAYIPSDAWLLDRNGEVIDSRRIRYDLRRAPWVELRDISPALVSAIVAGEDSRFQEHGAVDWRSVLGAMRDWSVHGRHRGASTIPMQLASLIQQRRPASGWTAWLDKARQVRLARALSARWARPQILEAYLNLLGYRGELQGIGAAAAQLTGKTPAGLTVPESLVLAALLPQPQAQPQHVVRRACARARTLTPVIDCAAVREVAHEMLDGGRELPQEHLAPQLAQALLHLPGERLRTSLDAAVQRRAVASLRTQLALLAERNVRDGAVLVVDNASGEVLAYVGSAGSASRAASVDGVRAPRQAGSTLKPFLYELALERRYLTAASMLADSPLTVDTANGLYIPQDYDHDFKGLVSVRTALAGSLNVPAVRTLALIGVEDFRDRLHALGYDFIREGGAYYGYSLALGSAEVNLWQQAQAYRALARGGEFGPITLAPGGNLSSAATAASPQPVHFGPPLARDAVFVVADMLSDPAARAVTFGSDNHLNTGFWSAVKTGTSEDMRDNWCIGFTARFTAAVWVGNFEGDSMHGVSGVTGAAPVWHDLMSALSASAIAPSAPAPPPGVEAHLTRFSPPVEPPRREWYLAGTTSGTALSAAVPAGLVPRIDSPAEGMIVALDPDIPAAHQRLLISLAGVRPGMQLQLNEESLGPARPQLLWRPRAGRYTLELKDPFGQTVNRVRFVVRGAQATGEG